MKAIFEANDNPILVMRDEAHFNLNGIVNQQNFCYWALQNPRELHAKQLHKLKVTVFCAVGNSTVIGSYFFENNNGNVVNVNSERHTEMIKNFFMPELWRKRVPIRCVWFHQDGATAHTTRASIDVILSLFSDRLISRFANSPWLPRTSGLYICDYFLWECLKVRVYEHKPCTLKDLKEAIRVEVAQIDRAMLESGGQLPRTPLEMHQWKRTPHEGYCFTNLNSSNANSIWIQWYH